MSSDVRRVALLSVRRFRTVASLSALALVPLGALVACGDGDAPARPRFDPDASQAALPEAGPQTDGPAPDARGVFDPKDEPVTCEATPCAVEIVAGDDHFCARLSDGTVRCWGDDSRGQRGIDPSGGGEPDEAPKVSVTGIARATQISAAGATTCARVDDGRVLCWGGNQNAELGRAIDPPFDEDAHPIPEPVAIDPAARVDVGHRSVCATTAAGAVYCWGNDESAQLARGEPAGPGLSPGPAQIGVVVKRTAAGFDTGFAIDETGAVLSWGAVAGLPGVLSGRVTSISPNPVPGAVHDLASVTGFAVSGQMPGLPPVNGVPGELGPPNQHACAISGGDVYCWGKSERGALGSGLPDAVVPLPTIARLGTTAYAQQIAAGGETTCVRLTDGNVACTGENERGQLGTGAAGLFASAFTTAITLNGRAVQVAVAKETVCALLQGGTVACWGGNVHGELGLGTNDDDPHPSATKVLF